MDIKMSAKKSAWATVLVLGKCCVFIICFTSFYDTELI